MQTPVLRYDKASHELCFAFSGSVPPYPCAMRVMRGQRLASFSARHPMRTIGARAFKNLYPEGLADKESIALIEEAKCLEEELGKTSLVEGMAKLFRVVPYSHQKEAIEYMLRYDRLALLLEQGLGKTFISLMAIMGLRHYGRAHQSLVVCPNIVFSGWLKECERFTDLKILPYKGNPKEREAQRAKILSEPWDIILTTFDMLVDRANATLNDYENVWRGLSPERRQHLAEYWVKEKLLDESKLAIVSNPESVGAWELCVRAISHIPARHFPMDKLRDARAQSNNIKFLLSLPFTNLVVDEASRCLDRNSRRSQAVEALARKARCAWLLSGTLCVGRPTDMFMPMRILGDDILRLSWTRFVQKFCKTAPSNPHIIIGYKHLDELKLLISPHILARKREECLDLPERIFTSRYYEPTREIRKLYNSIAQRKSVFIGNTEIHTDSPLLKIAKCQQVLSGFLYYDEQGAACNECAHIFSCIANNVVQGSKACKNADAPKLARKTFYLESNPKLNLLLEDLEENAEEKVIVWAWYQEDLRAIRKMLSEKKIPFVEASEPDCASKFESSDKWRVFLGQTSQGIGITLNSARTTIYYSHGTALEPRLQSMDRNYRIGQDKSVVVKDYICAGSIEDLLVGLLLHKADVKSFMQEKLECMLCSNCIRCLDGGISYLGKGCIHYGRRLEAEQIYRLKIPQLIG